MNWEPKDDPELKELQYKVWDAEQAVEDCKRRKVAELGFAAAKKFNVPPAKAAECLKDTYTTHTEDDRGKRVYISQVAAWMVRHNKTLDETRIVYGGYLNFFGAANVGMIADVLRHFEIDPFIQKDLYHVGSCMNSTMEDYTLKLAVLGLCMVDGDHAITCRVRDCLVTI